MPVLVKSISDEQLQGAGVHDLDPETPLLSAQAAALLGRSKTRMDSDRRDGKPPKHYLDGRKVLYPLGEVLEERARMRGITPEQAREAARKRVRQGGRTFNSFLGQASLDDTWPIATVRGRPMDLLATIGMDLDEEDLERVEDTTMERYLVARLEAGQRERAEQSQQLLRASTPAAVQTEAGPCSKCGRLHEGQCRL